MKKIPRESTFNFTRCEDVISFLESLSPDRLIILDFDETLFLRNSTEEYLNTIKPAILGYLVLRILDKLKPWNWLPKSIQGNESRDWVRVTVATIFFPWTLLLWKISAKKSMDFYENRDLSAAIIDNKSSEVIIATRGFEFIVKPLAKHLKIEVQEVIGCRFIRGGIDRNLGKDDLLRNKISSDRIERAVVVTDSLDDSSLLSKVEFPFLAKWPNSKYIPALSNIYLPFFYLERVKRPGSKFTVEVIIKSHLFSLIAAFSLTSPMPILNSFGMLFLLISFWCIYEIGYFENDLVAEKYEKKPTLSRNYLDYKSRMNIFWPWIYALLSATIGITFLHLSESITHTNVFNFDFDINSLSGINWVLSLLAWIGVLTATRLTFSAYNYLDERTRIWIYPFLQISKYLGFLVVSTTNLIGISLLVSQIFVEWIPYLIYRCGGNRKLLKENLFRFFIFTVFTLSISAMQKDFNLLLNLQFLIIFSWLLRRSKPDIEQLLKGARFIWLSTIG